jgi:hypothetical protein
MPRRERANGSDLPPADDLELAGLTAAAVAALEHSGAIQQSFPETPLR